MILCTSDLQFSDNIRDAYRFGVKDTISRMLKEHSVEWLYVLGDLTEAKDEHPASLVNRVTDIIREWTKHARVLILRGNHDYLDIAHPFFEFLKNFDGVKWINTPTEFNGALFLPHTRDYQRDWKSLQLYGQIYAHNIFEGTRAGNGHVLDGIPLNIFERNAGIISGDVHDPQSFDFVTYVGSPYTCDFGDDYDPRVLLIDGDKIKSLPVPGPQKRLIECAAGKGLLQNWRADSGDIIKVRVVLRREHAERWSEIQRDIAKWASRHGYILHSTEPVMDHRPQYNIESPRFAHKTDEQYLREYAARRGLDSILIKAGLRYLD